MSFYVKPTFLGSVLQLEIWGLTGPATISWDDPYDANTEVVAAPGGMATHDYTADGSGSAFVSVESNGEFASISMWLSGLSIMDRDMVSRWIDGPGAESPLDPNWWTLPIGMVDEGFIYMCYGHPIAFLSYVNTGKGLMSGIPENDYDNVVVSET